MKQTKLHSDLFQALKTEPLTVPGSQQRGEGIWFLRPQYPHPVFESEAQDWGFLTVHVCTKSPNYTRMKRCKETQESLSQVVNAEQIRELSTKAHLKTSGMTTVILCWVNKTNNGRGGGGEREAPLKSTKRSEVTVVVFSALLLRNWQSTLRNSLHVNESPSTCPTHASTPFGSSLIHSHEETLTAQLENQVVLSFAARASSAQPRRSDGK